MAGPNSPQEFVAQLRKGLSRLRSVVKVSTKISPALPTLEAGVEATIQEKLHTFHDFFERAVPQIKDLHDRIAQMRKILREQKDIIDVLSNKKRRAETRKYNIEQSSLLKGNAKFSHLPEWQDVKKTLDNYPKMNADVNDRLAQAEAKFLPLIHDAEEELARLTMEVNTGVEHTRTSIAAVLAKNAPKKNGSLLPHVAVPGKSKDGTFVTVRGEREAKKEKNRKGRWPNPPITKEKIVNLPASYPQQPSFASFDVSRAYPPVPTPECKDLPPPPVTEDELRTWESDFIKPHAETVHLHAAWVTLEMATLGAKMDVEKVLQSNNDNTTILSLEKSLLQTRQRLRDPRQFSGARAFGTAMALEWMAAKKLIGSGKKNTWYKNYNGYAKRLSRKEFEECKSLVAGMRDPPQRVEVIDSTYMDAAKKYRLDEGVQKLKEEAAASVGLVERGLARFLQLLQKDEDEPVSSSADAIADVQDAVKIFLHVPALEQTIQEMFTELDQMNMPPGVEILELLQRVLFLLDKIREQSFSLCGREKAARSAVSYCERIEFLLPQMIKE